MYLVIIAFSIAKVGEVIQPIFWKYVSETQNAEMPCPRFHCVHCANRCVEVSLFHKIVSLPWIVFFCAVAKADITLWKRLLCQKRFSAAQTIRNLDFWLTPTLISEHLTWISYHESVIHVSYRECDTHMRYHENAAWSAIAAFRSNDTFALIDSSRTRAAATWQQLSQAIRKCIWFHLHRSYSHCNTYPHLFCCWNGISCGKAWLTGASSRNFVKHVSALFFSGSGESFCALLLQFCFDKTQQHLSV